MPADFLNRNATDAVGMFSDQWKLAEEQDEFCISITTMHTHANKCSC
jgi:hypothetical protein